MRRSLPVGIFIISLSAHAQTGPGGVGTSTTNVLWLSADNGVTSSGGAVSAWADRSGNGNDAAFPAGQPTAKPSLITNSTNYYPSLDFDGTNDELIIPDNASLDMAQWDIFLVGAVDQQKSNNSWLCKGNYLLPNYALQSTLTGQLQLPILDLFGFLTAPFTTGGQVSGSFGLTEYSNTLTILTLSYGRNAYTGGAGIFTDLGLNLPLANAAPLRIGGAQGAGGFFLDGDIAELVIFNAPISPTRRIIVNNYLAAKYAVPLSSDDLYTQDEEANGNYDHDVAGIGRLIGSTHTDSRGSGIVRINNASALGNGEFLFWGHDNGVLGTWPVGDLPSGIEGRWERVWRVSEVATDGSSTDVGAINIAFDLTGIGSVTASDLRLLVDSDNDGLFADETPISGATSLGGGMYEFAGVTALADGLRFTLGTIDLVSTPLPIELVSFQATDEPGHGVLLEWITASEVNNDHFTIERSNDAFSWEPLMQIPGAGNSVSQHEYSWLDADPFIGVSYYRLGQTDVDGSSTWSGAVMVHRSANEEPILFPNPASERFVLRCAQRSGVIQMIDANGREVPVDVQYSDDAAEVNVSQLRTGVYSVRFTTASGVKAMPVVIGPEEGP